MMNDFTDEEANDIIINFLTDNEEEAKRFKALYPCKYASWELSVIEKVWEKTGMWKFSVKPNVTFSGTEGKVALACLTRDPDDHASYRQAHKTITGALAHATAMMIQYIQEKDDTN